MREAICSVCRNPVAPDEELMIGQIFVCGHCQTIYHVVNTDPFELQPLGNTGDLAGREVSDEE